MSTSPASAGAAVVEIDLPAAPPRPDPTYPARTHAPPPRPTAVRIGEGRSAVVDRVTDAGGCVRARKLFLGDPLAKLVHVVLSGAPNPYAWNDDAVAAAVCRRRLLATLVDLWFGDRLRLPDLGDASWNDDARAFQIEMEFVSGRGPALTHHAASGSRGGSGGGGGGGDELRDLVTSIMRPLQRHLAEAGFDGLVWQAGLGNPVAASNFLLEPTADTTRHAGWVWIDLESGVPALFPLNPLRLIDFYLPRSFRYGRPLFDDVDVTRLHAYLDERRGTLIARLGPDGWRALLADVETLATHQTAWKIRGRFRSSLEHATRRGHVAEAEAAYYAARPVRWYARLARRALRRTPGTIARVVRRAWRVLVPDSLVASARSAGRFLFSQRWRTRWAAVHVRRRIRSWTRRRQLTADDARHLTAHVRSEEATAYLTDFGIHVAIKAPVKAVEWFVFPALFAAGVIDEVVLLVALAVGGTVGRTAYTLGRMVQATARREERPWIALGVGLLPVVGNAAYPAQMLYTSAERDHDVAKFILFDLFTTLGRKLPVWGGPDTQTEHFFNRIPSRFLRWTSRGRGAPAAGAASEAPRSL